MLEERERRMRSQYVDPIEAFSARVDRLLVMLNGVSFREHNDRYRNSKGLLLFRFIVINKECCVDWKARIYILRVIWTDLSFIVYQIFVSLFSIFNRMP